MSQNFAQKLEIYKQKLEQIPTTSFNTDQKKLALEILEKAQPHNLEAIFSLLTKRIDVGFVFDIAPEVQQDAICLLKHDKDLSFAPALCQQQHAMIFGENYDALKNLLVLYRGKVDCIYIDPPYNTESTKQDGNDYKSEQNSSGKFGYRDKFMRTGWLNMLNERLKLAKDLLSQKGVIFISIDDSEQAYLKVLCDEVFGEGNFVANLVWQKKTGSSDATHIAVITEYILVYAKNQEVLELKQNTQAHDEKRYRCRDAFESTRGRYYLDTLDRGGLSYSDSLNYGIACPDGTIIYPNKRLEYKNDGWIWKWGKEKVKWGLENGFIDFRKSKSGQWKVCYKVYLNVDNEGKPIERAAPFKNLLTEVMNNNATQEIQAIFGNIKAFATPKPTALMKKILQIATTPNSLVLDFYAGSGTTGQAVMELNREDGGNRRCILVTSTENNIAQGVMYERIYRICHGKGTKGESFAWADKNKPFKDQGWEVFEGQTHHLKIDDYETGEYLKEVAIEGFKTLEPNCNLGDELDIYYTLSCLTPQKKEI
ncbi:site-specific DNA-methyltransferase [Helicobacter baculiformis]|uniref:site-specific DNA-methyltransferase (adenine-specific) n=1 Tax=Helicobacter baculiformis TaxID=427351 RepID=A0ABV7ZL06_9HELI|nr:site-specific DNA-methyltransferase [Helicobacter baculiformis]